MLEKRVVEVFGSDRQVTEASYGAKQLGAKYRLPRAVVISGVIMNGAVTLAVGTKGDTL